VGRAAADDVPFVAQARGGPTPFEPHRGQIAATPILPLHALESIAEALVRVEVGGVARHALQMEALGGAPCEDVRDRLTLMGEPSPMSKSWPRILRRRPRRKPTPRGGLPHLQEEPSVHGDATARRERLAARGSPRERDGQPRRLPAWRPGPPGERQQITARFVYPEDGASFGVRFFSRTVKPS